MFICQNKGVKRLKRVLKIVSILFFVAVLAISGAVYYFYTHIKPILISEINKTLAVEVQVSDISISGIRDFPNLGIKFSNVSIDESTRYYKKKLLKADELNLFVDIWKLYKGTYIIDGVTLRGGTLHVADLAKGTNYDIVKPDTDTSSSAVSFEIKSLVLQKCKIVYHHIPSKFSAETFTPSSKIKLKYTDEITKLEVVTSFEKAFFTLDKATLVNKHDLSINTEVAINTKTEKVSISPSEVQVEEVNLKTQGTVHYGNRSSVDIIFANDNTSAQSLLSILPSSITGALEKIKLTGDIKLNGYLKGKTDEASNPSFGFDYKLQQSDLSVDGQSVTLNGINASGKLTMPSIADMSNASATCKLSEASSGSNKIVGDIAVANFNRPSITWDGEANLDAAFVLALAKDNHFETKSGRILVNGQLGLVYDTERGHLIDNSLAYAGTIKVEKLSGRITNPSLEVNNISLDVTGDNQKLAVKSLVFDYNNTQGSIKGYIEDYPSLFDVNSSAVLVGDMKVTNLNINELMYKSSESSTEKKETNDDLLPLKFQLKTELKNFKYNDFIASSMSGNMICDRTSISMPNVKIMALEGQTAAAIAIKKWGDNHLLDINADLSSINITKLFKEFNNFEQNEITDKNLSGTLSGKIVAKVMLDSKYEPIMPKLYAKADVVIENGALVNYEPLRELSSFVNIKDLENVRFKTLKNTIEIFDQTIFIPKMMIENNALNLEIEGTHTFDNYMKYSMGLSVAELLATKSNWIAKKAERRIEKNAKGGLTAYIIMEGTPDNLKITYDKATVKAHIKEEVKKEKENFIKALKGEATLKDTEVETKDYDNVWDE